MSAGKVSGSKKRSKCWDHFDEIKGSNPLCVICRHCGITYACGTVKTGVSNLTRHIVDEKCTVLFQKQVGNDKTQQTLKTETVALDDGKTKTDILLSGFFDKNEARRRCARMLVVDELPFSHVENEGFRYFSTYLNFKFEPSSRRTIVRDVSELYLEEKSKLKFFMDENAKRVCLTTNCWTSIRNTNYMVITSHFIDVHWRLQKRILSFCEIPDHKGETIGKMIESCLHDWGLENVMTITLDNASANDVAVKYVKKRLQRSNGVGLDGEYLHLRCSAHILNLIVGDGLKEKDASIQTIRNAVKFVKSSPARLKKFIYYVELERVDSKSLVQMDVPTRWNSTYLMLESALKFQKVFDRLAEDDDNYKSYFTETENGKKRQGPPTFEDWENAATFSEVLSQYYKMTLKFSVSLGVTSDCYFHEVWELLCHLKLKSFGGRSLLTNMAIEMQKKFDKYWGSFQSMNQLLLIAVVLDPRYKLDYFGFCFQDMYDEIVAESMTSKIKDNFVRLYDWYYTSTVGPTSSKINELVSSDDISIEQENIPTKDRWRHKKSKKSKHEIPWSGTKNEIDMYLLEDVVDPDNTLFDLLCWWKGNSDRFPVLSLMARDIFAIPISIVASESAFSTGGRVLDPFRSCLTPRMVESLVCTQNWLQSKKAMTNGTTMEEISLYELLDSEIYGPPSSAHMEP